MMLYTMVKLFANISCQLVSNNKHMRFVVCFVKMFLLKDCRYLSLLLCILPVLAEYSLDIKNKEATKARRGDYKYIASVQTLLKEIICGGVIISSNAVLTTCRCTKDPFKKIRDISNMKVVSGSVRLFPFEHGYQVRMISNILTHSSCNLDVGLYLHDFAVLITKRDFIFNSWVNEFPSELRWFTSKKKQDENFRRHQQFANMVNNQDYCSVVGFFEGNSSEKSVYKSLSMVSVQVRLKTHDICEKELKSCCSITRVYSPFNANGKICSNYYYHSYCAGNEGSPLICAGNVWAILSKPLFCQDTKYPVMYQDLLYGFNFWKTYLPKSKASGYEQSLLWIVLAWVSVLRAV